MTRRCAGWSAAVVWWQPFPESDRAKPSGPYMLNQNCTGAARAAEPLLRAAAYI